MANLNKTIELVTCICVCGRVVNALDSYISVYLISLCIYLCIMYVINDDFPSSQVQWIDKQYREIDMGKKIQGSEDGEKAGAEGWKADKISKLSPYVT